MTTLRLLPGAALLSVLSGAIAVRGAAAQTTTTIAAGSRYDLDPVRTWFHGQGYRRLWVVPIRVPVLDLAVTGGGLTPIERGGGQQTRTLQLRGKDGQTYLFRSVDKFVADDWPAGIKNTPANDIAQEFTASLHPAGALVVPGFLRAAGVLHVVPRLVVMPDDERLGEFRSVFAGMLGQFELKPAEGPNDSPGFAGSRKIIGMETMQERLLEDSKHHIASRDYLAARLVDFLVGDTDRGVDQWRWARFPDHRGGYLWRPIPRDRDWAFLNADGVGYRVARSFFKKLVRFNDELPSVSAFVLSSSDLDRQFLAGLDRVAWDSITRNVIAVMTDSVINAALRAMPIEYQVIEARNLARTLRARARELPRRSADFYAELSEIVDVRATDGRDIADLRRLPDGSVEVSLYSEATASRPITSNNGNNGNNGKNGDTRPYYYRRFVSKETREIRVYLNGGADQARITGTAEHSIAVRVIGGPGADLLVDSSRVKRDDDRTWFYTDDDNSDQIVVGPATVLERGGFEPSPATRDWLREKFLRGGYRDWGAKSSIAPAVDFQSNTGVLLGVTYRHQQFGFRHEPNEFEYKLKLLFAPVHMGIGAEFASERTFENSPWSSMMLARASQFDLVHFFGFGNDTPEHDDASVEQRRASLSIGLSRTLGEGGHIAFGAHSKFTSSDQPEAVLNPGDLEGSRDFTQIGVWTDGRIAIGQPGRERFTATISAVLQPSTGSVTSTYGLVAATTTVTIGRVPSLALRAGAEHAWGPFPFYDAATIGGRRSLRGYSTERFSGDQAVFGNAELRVPLTHLTLLTRGQLGVFALTDAGRVFVDGASPGGWHQSLGLGLWYSTLGKTVSFTYAHGEGNKFYIELGMPY